ncbi:MAG: peptidylprolyl isomerase [Akkermansiaceae bacterium]
MSKSFVIRMVIWSALIIYMLCDFLIFSGPLKREARRIFPSDADKIRSAVEEGVCAKVYNEPIYIGQVDRRVQENMWRSGRDLESIGEQEMKMLRWAALDDLIVEHIMRIKVRVNREEVPVSDEAIDAQVARFEKRFSSPEELDQALTSQGIESRKELRYRVAARIQQDKYVQSKISDAIKVSDEDARDWYDNHQEELTMPERRGVRHIFLASLDHSSDEAEAILKEQLKRIQDKKASFEKIALEVSEDESNKKSGGNLGWMRRDRLPGDFAAHVFSLESDIPTLIRTKLGWHIVEVTGVKQPELPAYETVKKEIITALSDMRRKESVEQYRHQLKLLNHEKVEIYKMALEPRE